MNEDIRKKNKYKKSTPFSIGVITISIGFIALFSPSEVLSINIKLAVFLGMFMIQAFSVYNNGYFSYYCKTKVGKFEELTGALIMFYGVLWFLLAMFRVINIFNDINTITIVVIFYVMILGAIKLIIAIINKYNGKILRVWLLSEAICTLSLFVVLLIISPIFIIGNQNLILIFLFIDIALGGISNFVYGIFYGKFRKDLGEYYKRDTIKDIQKE